MKHYFMYSICVKDYDYFFRKIGSINIKEFRRIIIKFSILLFKMDKGTQNEDLIN